MRVPNRLKDALTYKHVSGHLAISLGNLRVTELKDILQLTVTQVTYDW